MQNYFQDKMVWITGASSGIGAALAIECSRRGAQLILSSRNQEQLKLVQSQLLHPDKSTCIAFDVTDQEASKKVSEEILNRFGKVDIFIPSAGVSQRSKIITSEMLLYRKIMELNYFAVIQLCKNILPSMVQNKSGQIIVISSLAGKIAAPLRSAYCASKHALHGFFDCLRVEHYKDHIKVNIICPGYTRTNIALNALNSEAQSIKEEDEEISQGMDPNDLAKKILKAAENNIAESYFGGKEVLAIWLKRFLPKILQKIMIKRFP